MAQTRQGDTRRRRARESGEGKKGVKRKSHTEKTEKKGDPNAGSTKKSRVGRRTETRKKKKSNVRQKKGGNGAGGENSAQTIRGGECPVKGGRASNKGRDWSNVPRI